MATIRKLPSGKWQAQISRNSTRSSKTFISQAAAKDWAAEQEYVVLKGSDNSRFKGDLSLLLNKYRGCPR